MAWGLSLLARDDDVIVLTQLKQTRSVLLIHTVKICAAVNKTTV
ncbi:protein of unknown function [Vibrio tapetis subsp. tapetis]|uniref:Uncharacterized protein n=1 Tax=Vibrio tapetis subsp. tapetis TaxID=1671868 RepID=A0A2N8ZKI2_9VIBR|nr:protein of unknown function [Vibrio tapetis subsp. tapetis]